MYTEYFGPIDRTELNKSTADLERIARRLQQGGVIALPTETVYGLGASILSESALRRLRELKGSSSQQNFPIYLSNLHQLQFVAEKTPPLLELLAKAFLPGPLTMMLKKHPKLSDALTGRDERVSVTISSDPLMKKIIDAIGSPLAMPPASLPGNPSPTSATHVFQDFGGQIDGIVDGGSTQFGIESTLLSLEDPTRPTLYRFGAIDVKSLESVLGMRVEIHPLALLINPESSLTKLTSVIRLFSSWEEMNIYLKLSSKSKRMILSDEKPRVKGGDHFELKSSTLYEGLRKANQESYTEVLVYCSSKVKQNSSLYQRLKQIAMS